MVLPVISIRVTACTALSAACSAVERRMTELVIELFLFRVVEHRVSLGYLLELLLRVRIACIGVRMVFLGHLSIGLFYIAL